MLQCSNYGASPRVVLAEEDLPVTRKSNLLLFAGAFGVAAAAGFLVSRATGKVVAKRSPARGRFIQVDGAWLHVLQQGSGPDVLLIHGAAMLADEMMLALGHAFPGQRVTAVDRPGHGHSSRRRRPSIADQARLLHQAAAELGLERPVIVGHSLGGAVALSYGEQFPDDVSGVVAVAPLAYPGWGPAHLGRALRGAPVLGPVLSNTVQALVDPLMMRAVMRLIFSPQKPTPAFKQTVDVGLLARPHAMVADGGDFVRASLDLEPLSRRYGTFPAPLHVIVGEQDRILKPARQGKRLAQAVPGAGLTVLPGSGHMLHHFAPQAVTAAVAAVRDAAGQPEQDGAQAQPTNARSSTKSPGSAFDPSVSP
jgi:pimeloyl-ACP methyl ester carboxylesterase